MACAADTLPVPNEAADDADVLKILSFGWNSSFDCCDTGLHCFILYGGGGVPGGVVSSSFSDKCSQIPEDVLCAASKIR